MAEILLVEGVSERERVNDVFCESSSSVNCESERERSRVCFVVRR